MAEKSVNININYKVNTVEIQKAEQLLKSAQNATNNLQSSAQKAGQSTSNAFDKLGGSIETLRGRVLFLKEAITQSSDPKKIATLSAEYKKLKTQLDQVNKSAFELPKAIKETGAASQSLAGKFGQLYTAAKLVFTAGIIKEVVTAGLEMARLSGNVDGVSKAFNRTFPGAQAMLEKLRKSTHGTLTDFELMQRALKAQNLGVPIENLGKLLEFAATRAQQTGDSVDYLVGSIIDGLGRKSILKLDNLGVSASRLKEAMGGISTQAATVAQVTEAFTKVAGEELQKMGGYAETSATKVDKLTVAWTQLGIEVAKKPQTNGIIDFLTDAITGLGQFLKGSEAVRNEQIKLLGSQDAARVLESKSFKELGENQQKKIDFIQQEMNSRVQLIGRYNDTIAAQTKERRVLNERILTEVDFGGVMRKRVEVLTNSMKAEEANKLVLASTILVLKDYLEEYEAVTDEQEKSLGLIESLQMKIEALGDDIQKAMTVEDIERLNIKLVGLETQLKELQELGKTPININASLVFDIKQGVGKKKAIKDLISSEELNQDTIELGKELGDKLGEGIEKSEGLSTALERAFFNAKEDLINGAIDITANSLMAIQQLELESYDNRLANIRDFYDQQQILAGDNQRAKDRLALEEERKTSALRKRAAEKEKQARIFGILIDTAASIAKTAAQLGFPAAIPFIALAAANGAAQLSIASRAQPRGFKDGVLNLNGPGTGTSDSIPSRLSKGESVMTAKEWQTSKNVLKEVRAKTLDDDVLRDLKVGRDGVKYVGMDDKRLLSKLDEVKNSFPDIEERAGILYRTKKKNENYRMWVRKSTMG